MEAAKRDQVIEHQIGGIQNDTLRFGLSSVKGDIVRSHPVESASESEMKEKLNKRFLTNTYGSALSLRNDLDRQILSRFQRPPGPIPSSMLGLEALTGTLVDFGVEDYLNDPVECESARPLDMHHGMEVRLGLSICCKLPELTRENFRFILFFANMISEQNSVPLRAEVRSLPSAANLLFTWA